MRVYGNRVSQSLGAAKSIMEDTVLLAQKNQEIDHLRQKVERFRARIDDKNKRLRDGRRPVDRHRHLKDFMVEYITEKVSRTEKDKEKISQKVKAEANSVKQKMAELARTDPLADEWKTNEDADDQKFLDQEKKFEADFLEESVELGKRVRGQHAEALSNDIGVVVQQATTELDDSDDEAGGPARKQAKTAAKKAGKGAEISKKIAPGKTTAGKTPASLHDDWKAAAASASTSKAATAASKGGKKPSGPKGGKAVAKPDPKPKAAASKGITKPSGPKSKKEPKGPRTYYAIWMGHEDTKLRYAQELEEVKARGDEKEMEEFQQPIKKWYSDAWKLHTSEEEKARFQVLAAEEEKAWLAKGWVRPAKASKTAAATKKKPAKKEEEGSDSDNDGDAEMEGEEESEDEAEAMDEGSDNDEAAAKAAVSGGDKEGEEEEEKEAAAAEPHPGTLGIKATVNKTKKAEEEPKSKPASPKPAQKEADSDASNGESDDDSDGDDKKDKEKPKGNGDKSENDEGNESDSSHSPSE